ncbi:DASH complex subunit spc19 [Sporothrix curviconia]|uniref:DASH complex subunit SPC19 n=1 Tax=Sporothrix curviconia TaxID=1260050 RepID=A0ABP0CVP1_9PEZI
MALYSAHAQPSPTLALYGDCVASLRTSLAYLESANATLGASPHRLEEEGAASASASAAAASSGAVADMPRFGSVVKTVRHYELVPQPTLAAAEASLQNEIGPAVAALLDRASHQLARQARRIDTLQARAALQAGRLEEPQPSSSSRGAAAAAQRTGKATATVTATAGPTSDLRARMIHQRKEQLKYSVARLEREVAQKERELRQRLRQSMAG